MRRTGSLYDGYQLANSTVVPQFQGSAGAESIQVGQYLQGLYDTNLAGALTLSTNLDNLTGHAADDPIIRETRDMYKAKLAQASEKGDFENLLPQIHQLGAQYANDARAINSIVTAKSEWLKNLDDKEKNLTSAQKAGLLKEAEYKYATGNSKLRRDASGKLVGSYEGTSIDKNIDVAKKVDDWMKGSAEHKGGSIREGSNGTWLIKNGNSWDVMTPKQIRNIIQPAMRNDQEFQAYADMEGRVQRASTLGVTDPSEIKDGPLKLEAIKLSKEQGIPFGTALQEVAYKSVKDAVFSNADSYAVNKYMKNNVETSQTMSADPFKVIEKTKEVDEESNLTVMGGEVIVGNDEKDPEKLIQKLNTTQDQINLTKQKIDRLNKDLGVATGDKRIIIQTQIKALEATLNEHKLSAQRSELILNTARDKAANMLNYPGGYSQMKNTLIQSAVEGVRKLYPKGLTLNSGRVVSVEELAEAIVENRTLDKYSNPTPAFGVAGSTASVSSGAFQGITIRLKDGTQTFINSNLNAAGLKGLIKKVTNDNAVKNFNSVLKKAQSDLTRVSVSDVIATFNDKDRKRYQPVLDVAFSTAAIKKVGDNKVISEDEKSEIDKTVVTGLSAIKGPNGEDRMIFDAFDKDGKRIGSYEMNVQSDAGQAKARQMGSQTNLTARSWADLLTGPGNSTVRMPEGFKSEAVGKMKVSDDGPEVDATVGKGRNPETGKTNYYLIDQNNQNVIKVTDNLADYTKWMNRLTGTPNFTDKTKSPRN